MSADTLASRASPTAPDAARARECPLCGTQAGVPCQAKPEGDHLARYLDAYTAGQLTRAYMAAVVGELVVIEPCQVILGQFRGLAGVPGTGEL